MPNLKKFISVDAVVDASPEQVWAVMGDPTRVGEWSHECRGAVWCDGATRAEPGARFRGTNKVGRTRWSRTSEVVATDAPRELAWRTIPSRLYPDSTLWRITLEPVDGGTRITQSYEVLKLNPIVGRLFCLLIPQHRDRTDALARDVRALGEVARTGVPAAS